MEQYLGEFLGNGNRRKVYKHNSNPDYVIKVLINSNDNHNNIEWQNWNKLKNTEKAKWLAPCISLSDCGQYLVQQFGNVIDYIPKNIPDWIKVQRDYSLLRGQWVEIDDRICMCDYGFARFK